MDVIILPDRVPTKNGRSSSAGGNSTAASPGLTRCPRWGRRSHPYPAQRGYPHDPVSSFDATQTALLQQMFPQFGASSGVLYARCFLAKINGAFSGPPLEGVVERTLLRVSKQEAYITNRKFRSGKIIECHLLANGFQAIAKGRLFSV